MNCIPGLNVYDLLTVDLLHEVELGVWKGVFTHIIRILWAHSPAAVSELDKRYASCWDLIHTHMGHRFRLITPFGKGTIRRFASNASQMKKLAAHNFEDLLQV
jgi:hypothetical protein